jgi:DnaJ-class molecular chaperone
VSKRDHYAVLGVPRSANAEAVRDAFHAFARRYHPDRWMQHTEAEREEAARTYRQGAEAYRVLMDPAARADYDATLPGAPKAKAGRSPESAASSSAMALRNPRARPFVQQAQAAIRAGDLRTAKLNLTLALNADPGNPAIEALFREIAPR